MSVPPFRPPVAKPLHGPTWERPVGNHEFRVTQTFAHTNPQYPGVIHAALDLGSGQVSGRDALSPADGVVVAEGWLREPWSASTAAYGTGNFGGIMTVIRHGPDYISALAHMWRTVVNAGWSVKKGQKVGEVGATGSARAAGTHLHWDLYQRLPITSTRRVDGYLVIAYAGSKWQKVDAWPLLEQNWVAPPDTAIAATAAALPGLRFGGADIRWLGPVSEFSLTAPTNFRSGPTREAPSLTIAAAGTPLRAAYGVAGEPIGDNDAWARTVLYVDTAYVEGFIHSSLLKAAALPTTGIAQEDLDRAVTAATAPLKQRIATKDAYIANYPKG